MLECNDGMKNTFTSMPLSAEEVLTYGSKKNPAMPVYRHRESFFMQYLFLADTN